MSSAPPRGPTPANLLRLDYRAEAARLGPPPDRSTGGAIDIHSHITGPNAARVYADVRKIYGVRRTYTMTNIAGAGAIRDVLGDSVRFIAFPSFDRNDMCRSHGEGYLETIERFATEFDSRMLKLWNGPRLRDLIPRDRWPEFCEFDSLWRRRACELGQRLGMMFMAHIADPDTWFATRYADASSYGAKRDTYAGFERMLDRFHAPWIGAHMGGFPEDLRFLDDLLERHPNLYLDVSATKWIVRELSKGERADVAGFFVKWKGRILFGSDIVATDDHLSATDKTSHPMGDLANSPESAWELYASRYWALRVLLETDYEGPSPIADPDLAMVDPARYSELSSPRLRGLALPRDVLEALYVGVAEDIVESWWQRQGG